VRVVRLGQPFVVTTVLDLGTVVHVVLSVDPSALSEMQSVSSNTEFVSVAERLHNTNQAKTGKRHGALKHRFRKVPSPRFAADVPPPSAPGTAGSTQTTPGGTTVMRVY